MHFRFLGRVQALVGLVSLLTACGGEKTNDTDAESGVDYFFAQDAGGVTLSDGNRDLLATSDEDPSATCKR